MHQINKQIIIIIHIIQEALMHAIEPPPIFYQHVSDIIKLFRKQLSAHLKIQNSFFQDNKQQIQQLSLIYQQGKTIAQNYTNVSVQAVSSVMLRLMGRLKQILQLTTNISNSSVNLILNSIKKLQYHMHKNIQTIKVKDLICQILIIIPQKYKKVVKAVVQKRPKRQDNKQNVGKQKSNSLQNILQHYKKSYNLLAILNIDECEYRATFFSAREDWLNHTNIHQTDMIYRNRFIREEIQRYGFCYNNYREKVKNRQNYISTKKRTSKFKRLLSMTDQSTNISKPSSFKSKHTLSYYQDESNQNSPILEVIIQPPSFTQPAQNYKQKSFLLSGSSNINNFKDGRQYKSISDYEPNKTYNKNNHFSKNCPQVMNQTFFEMNQLGKKNQFRLTKVLFGCDGKLQLCPINQAKKQSPSVSLKNKIVFRKVQQHIRKKLNNLNNLDANNNQINKNKNIVNLDNYHKKSFNQLQRHSNLQPKNKKFTWKDREIKYLGVKGKNSFTIQNMLQTSYSGYKQLKIAQEQARSSNIINKIQNVILAKQKLKCS